MNVKNLLDQLDLNVMVALIVVKLSLAKLSIWPLIIQNTPFNDNNGYFEYIFTTPLTTKSVTNTFYANVDIPFDSDPCDWYPLP